MSIQMSRLSTSDATERWHGQQPAAGDSDCIRRIHIVGGPGSGKSTLARALSSHFNMPVFDLDDVAGDGVPSFFVPTNPLGDRAAAVAAIAAGSTWITEGSYLWWTAPLFAAAQLVIWLDPPRRVALWAITRRYLYGLVDWRSPRRTFRSLRHPHLRWYIAFMFWSWRYYSAQPHQRPPQGMDETSREMTAQALAPHSTKVRRFSRAPAATVVVRNFNSLGEART